MTKRMKNQKRKERIRKKKLIDLAIKCATGYTVSIEKQKKVKVTGDQLGIQGPHERIATFTEEEYIPPNPKLLNALIKAGIFSPHS